MSEINDLLEASKEVLRATRSEILRLRGKSFQTQEKADSTLVTEVDRATEEVARATIMRLFPDHGIVGEEFSSHNPASEYRWIIDPIDGTQNFFHRIPTYGTILALYKNDSALVSAIDHPELDLQVIAGLGLGAYANEVKINRTIATSPLEKNDILIVSPPYNFYRGGDDAAVLNTIMGIHPHWRIYYDCFAHTLAVQGKVRATIDVNLHLWDIAATKLLIEESGGAFCEVRTYIDESGDPIYDSIFGDKRTVEYLTPIVRELLTATTP